MVGQTRVLLGCDWWRQREPGGSRGLAGWLSRHVGIGRDPSLRGSMGRAEPQPWQHQSTPRVPGRAGAPTATATAPRHGRVEMGCRNAGARGGEELGFALSITTGQGLAAGRCRPGAGGLLGVTLSCPHSPGCSVPYPILVCPPGRLGAASSFTPHQNGPYDPNTSRQVLLCNGDSKGTAPATLPLGPHTSFVCRVPTLQGHLESATLSTQLQKLV